jgi:hypothetical protein
VVDRNTTIDQDWTAWLSSPTSSFGYAGLGELLAGPLKAAGEHPVVARRRAVRAADASWLICGDNRDVCDWRQVELTKGVGCGMVHVGCS